MWGLKATTKKGLPFGTLRLLKAADDGGGGKK